MNRSLVAWYTRHHQPPLVLEHLTDPPAPPRRFEPAFSVMRGPVDPAHDPCGRPPLPPAEVNHG